MAYNRLFNPATWDDVNSENKELLDDYILELKSNGKSEKTIYQYVADIKGFYSWVYDNAKNKNILDLKKRVFRNFFLYMQEHNASSARINRLQSSIRNILEFASQDEDEYDYDVNAMRSIKSMKGEKVRDIVFLTDEQVTKIIDYLLKEKQYQKALYVSLSYDSAARRNEVAQVEKHGFVENNQTNQVVGKRAKKFNLIYFKRTQDIAKLWLEQRGEDDIDSLWANIRGKEHTEVSYDTFYSWAVSLRKILHDIDGSDLEINSHSFRHSALESYSQGTHYALAEMGREGKKLDLNTLRVIAHHTDVSTTQNYLSNHDDELIEKAFGISL